jgi:hypothetical protein
MRPNIVTLLVVAVILEEMISNAKDQAHSRRLANVSPLAGPHGSFSNPEAWKNITMPTVSYFASMGFPAPSDAAVWERAKLNAMSGKQVLLEQVLNTIHSPADILSGDIKFRRQKKLVDFDLCERTGFEPMKGYGGER